MGVFSIKGGRKLEEVKFRMAQWAHKGAHLGGDAIMRGSMRQAFEAALNPLHHVKATLRSRLTHYSAYCLVACTCDRYIYRRWRTASEDPR